MVRVRELTASAVRAIQRHRTKVLVIDDAHFIKTVCKDARDIWTTSRRSTPR